MTARNFRFYVEIILRSRHCAALISYVHLHAFDLRDKSDVR